MTAMLDDEVKGAAARSGCGSRPPRLPTTERRYLSHEQVADLAEQCGPYRTLVLTLAYTGSRWSEAAGPRGASVDLLRRHMEVAEAVVDVNGRLVLARPKTIRRSVPLPRFLVDELVAQLAGKAPDEFVFTSPRGATLRVHSFRRSHFDRAMSSGA